MKQKRLEVPHGMSSPVEVEYDDGVPEEIEDEAPSSVGVDAATDDPEIYDESDGSGEESEDESEDGDGEESDETD